MKFIFITGATSGFGKAVATRFAMELKSNATLILTGRRKERLDQLQNELSETYDCSVIPLAFDVRSNEEVKMAVASLAGHNISSVDVLVNNAGLAAGLSTIDEGNTDDWDQMIDTNLRGLLYVTRAVVPFMKSKPGSHIINIGSTAGKMVYKNGNVYCATKHAVDALTQAMRVDLLPYGVKVTGINPGLAETEFSIVRFKGDEARAKSFYEGYTPLRAEDIADAAWYCTSLPPHVCINDLTITGLTQADSVHKIKTEDLVNRK